MVDFEKTFIVIVVGLVVLLPLITNVYWGLFIIIITQPIFVASWEGSSIGVSKVIYGVLFSVWFIVWILSYLAGTKNERNLFIFPVTAPTFALGIVLGLAILNGLVNGASLDEIGRDLSSYLGYLALLPVLCIVRKPEQARKVLLLLVLVGLPAFVLSQLVWIGRKQDLASASLPYFPAATAYWEPIQGTLWAIAISHKDNGKKIAAWGWICITSLIIVLGGYRTYFIALCLAGATAFLGGGKLSRDSMAKYLIPLFLSLIVGGLLADLAGLVKLPLSRITRDRYATMLSSNNLKEDTSIQGRVFETKILMEGFMQNPFLGIGFGHRIIRGENKRVIGWLSFRPHNGYAEILMKFGIFGTLVFGWYFMVILRMAYRCMANGDTYFSKAVALGVLIWLIPSFAISLAGSLFSDRGFSLTVGIMAGILPALAGQHIFQKDSIRAERIRVYAPQA